ncbi:thiamine-phosphate kinase [Arthrobacter pullicola]|uniref:thiamine-phosphate kinase n=1 Tax=Arthrobacter pullicola TaxID=2762224 RepID=UPI00296B43EB|nr:thiamine-phosphate kinase [Arthrobacter pullicola]
MAEHPRYAGDLSEGELLARIFPRLGSGKALLGPGDDAALLAAPDGRTVISIDTLVQDQDFRLAWPGGYRTTGYDVGWKCAAQNLSDINAMGAVPTSLVVSLTLPPNTLLTWVEDLADGLSAALRALGAEDCVVAGGDLGRGEILVVTAAVTGGLQGRDPVLRSGALPGDMLAVCGVLGHAAAGLALLDGGTDYASLDGGARALTAAQSRPCPPLVAGPAAAAAGAHAMMDISDGVVRDAVRLALASEVRIDLDPQALLREAGPLAEAAERLGAKAVDWVLGGGEDHGLLAAFAEGAELPRGFRRIGTVLEREAEAAHRPGQETRGSGRTRSGGTGSGKSAGLVTVGGRAPSAAGWDHFAG